MRLLLISSSTATGYAYLEYPKPYIKDFLGQKGVKIAFVPFAGLKQSYENLVGYDAYEKKIQAVFSEIGYEVNSVHRESDALMNADAVLVGGGNTFNLLKQCQDRNLMESIKDRVLNDNIPYIGLSAGTNLACPTIRTTNDMPIIEPRSFNALGFIPFQINPHYLDAAPDGHFGESREERIIEFLEVNRDMVVAGLREGMMFRIEDDRIKHEGVSDKMCRIFKYGQSPLELGSNDDFSFLLK
ncbi:Alpha-aspartyl dipeptidase Peptidase E (EC [Olavius sp. associated proteobacterium Delta 1]|nr:Alpha-aspartyl dipeptidase Peptidase E (EC [Olavius sp. associated proteobacterium Delta 1]